MDEKIQKGFRGQITLATVFISMSVVCSCLAMLRFQMLLVSSDWFDAFTDNMTRVIPVDASLTYIVVQCAGLILAITILAIWRQPNILWLFIAAQAIWLIAVGLNYFLQGIFSYGFGSEIYLWLVFGEPACVLVIACVATFKSLWSKNTSLILATSVLVFLSVIAEIYTIIAIQMFAAALGAMYR